MQAQPSGKAAASGFGAAAPRQVLDDPRVLFFRLSPEVTVSVKRFLESRGWIDLTLRQPHPAENSAKLVGAGSSADQRKRPARTPDYYSAVPPLWSLWWEDFGFIPQLLSTLARSQMLNHLVTAPTVYRKDVLALRMLEASEVLSRENPSFLRCFRSFPESFILPRHQRQLNAAIDRAAAAAAAAGLPRPVWIHKPTAAARGYGIFLFDDKKTLEERWTAAQKPTCVVQKYIPNPLLIGSPALYKFDLRLYVLLERSWPFRLHIHPRGLVRFASQPYEALSLDRTRAHLTNFTLNKSTVPKAKPVGSTVAAASGDDRAAVTAAATEATADDGANAAASDAIDFDRPVDGPSGPKWELRDLWAFLDERCYAPVAAAAAPAAAPPVAAAAAGTSAAADAGAGAGTGADAAAAAADAPVGLPVGGRSRILRPALWAAIKHVILLAMTPTAMSVLPAPTHGASADAAADREEDTDAAAPAVAGAGAAATTVASPPDAAALSDAAAAVAAARALSSAPADVGAPGPTDPLWGYELLGVDVLVDSEGKPHLLEINRSPAMLVSTPADTEVKSKVLHDLFNMLRVEERLLAAKEAEFAAGTRRRGPRGVAFAPTTAWQMQRSPTLAAAVAAAPVSIAAAKPAASTAAGAVGADADDSATVAAVAAGPVTAVAADRPDDSGASDEQPSLRPSPQKSPSAAISAAAVAEPVAASALACAPASSAAPSDQGVPNPFPGHPAPPGADGSPVSPLVHARALSAVRYTATPCEFEQIFPPRVEEYRKMIADLASAHSAARLRCRAAAHTAGEHPEAPAASAEAEAAAPAGAAEAWAALEAAAAARISRAASQAERLLVAEGGGRAPWKQTALAGLACDLMMWWETAAAVAVKAADEAWDSREAGTAPATAAST